MHELIGESPVFTNVLAIADRISTHDLPILLEGEKSTGKHSIARRIHQQSPRSENEFIIVDCSIASEAILESELFGYVRGSFAGAIHNKKGLLELADHGTLYLDQIAKMKPSLQSKLIHFLEDNSFFKLGGVEKIHSDVRVIASTENNLKECVERGKFREDLYYKLSPVRISLPPLRERKQDILLLAGHFLKGLAKELKVPQKPLSREAENMLLLYTWPGNIRELEQVIRRAAILTSAKIIGTEHFQMLRQPIQKAINQNSPVSLKEQKRKVISVLEKDAILEALKKTKGNRSHASKLLSISRQELIRKISHYKIKR